MRKINKKCFILLLLLVFMFVFSSCTPSESAQSVSSKTQSHEKVDKYGREYIEDSVPDNLKFDGETVTIFVREGELYEMEFGNSEETEESTINTALIERNAAVEEHLGIKLKTLVKVSEDKYDALNFNNAVRTSILSGSSDFDIVASYAYFGVTLGNTGLYYNLHDLKYLDLSKPWWNQDFVNEMTINNKLYFAIGDASFTSTDLTYATFFNKDLLSQWYQDINLYKVVDDGNWTLDYFQQLLKDTYTDLDGDGTRSDKDFYGAAFATAAEPLDAFFVGSDLSITTKNDKGYPELSFYNQETMDFFNKMYDILFSTNGVYAGKYTVDSVDMMRQKFKDSESIFLITPLSTSENLRDVQFTYGILPIPKANKDQTDYSTCAADYYSLLSVPVNLSEDRLPLVGATLELLAAESYRTVTPAYFEVIMKYRYLQSDDDARMYDLVLNGVKYNFGIVNSISLNDIQHLVREVLSNRSKDFTSAYQKKEELTKLNLEELLSYYNE